MWMNVDLNQRTVALIAGFEGTIEEIPILAAFLPMVTVIGGNVGFPWLCEVLCRFTRYRPMPC